MLFNERWHAMESALRQLQQRVDVVSTVAAARHGVGDGTGASPAGASPGGGGGGSVGRGPLAGRDAHAPRGAGGRRRGMPDGRGGGGGFRSAGSGAAAAMYGSPHFRGQRAQ